MSQSLLPRQQLAALRAIKDGRIPSDEALLSRLRRWGLIGKAVLGPRRYFVTDDGNSVLAEASREA